MDDVKYLFYGLYRCCVRSVMCTIEGKGDAVRGDKVL